MGLDLSFLEVPFGPTPVSSLPVNVYDILGEGWRENRVDMTLLFFLDPNERHGLGALVMDALLRVLDGAPLIGPQGKTGTSFVAADYEGSDAWEVGTQVGNIDVCATNGEQGLVVAIENKIGARLNNPLARYAKSALADREITDALMVVLAPERRVPGAEQEPWLSRAITYAELADEIRRSPGLVQTPLDPKDRNQQRSLELLQQFIEARTGDNTVTDLSSEADRLEEWRALLAEHQDAIAAFNNTRRDFARLLRERSMRLGEVLADRIAEARLEIALEAHSGARSRLGADFWNAYTFAREDWSVELKLSDRSDRPSLIYVQDYEGQIGGTYKHRREEPLGLGWTASDSEIADAFIERVKMILQQVRDVERPG